MKKLFVALLALTSLSSFAAEVHCTDKAPYGIGGEIDPSLYTMKFNTKTQNRADFELVGNLLLTVKAFEEINGLLIVVGKNVTFGGGGAWNPIASTDGVGEVKLAINRNAIASKIYLGGYDFPHKKLGESKEKYFARLKDYIEKENDVPLMKAFDQKYGELANIHCKLIK